MGETRRHNLENGLWRYDIATDRYDFSPGVSKILGLAPQELNSHDAFLDYIHPADIDYYTDSFREKINEKQSFVLSYRMVMRDGSEKNIEESVEFLTDGEGRVTSYYGIVSDITSFISLQDEKGRTFGFINSILGTLPNLIFVKNIDQGFQFSFVNENFASFYGLTAASIIGKYDKDISTPEQSRACYVTDQMASKHDITTPLLSVEEIPISKKNIKYMQTIKFAHTINGTHYLICSAMDISDLVNARKKAEESNRLKSVFLHTISHEIRTPMNSIMGYSQLIGRSKDKTEMESFCKKIKGNSEQLLNLITDIVYLANLETASKNLVYEDIDMEQLLENVKAQYEGQATYKHLDLIYTPHARNIRVYSNRDAIMQLVKCFVENAIKFTNDGSVTMGYDVKNGSVKIWVKDTGIGIEKRLLRSVFRRFVKLDEFTPGTGIGLYISQKIVKSMKGQINIQSTPGKGTYICAELPLDSAEKENI